MVFPPGSIALAGDLASRTLDRLGGHRDRSARAFGRAQPAALAVVVVDGEALARTELHHCVVRAHAVAVVALEAIAAREAAPRLEQRVALVQSGHGLLEGRRAAGHVEH